MASYYAYSFVSGIFYFMRFMRAAAYSSNSCLYWRKIPINEKNFTSAASGSKLFILMHFYFSLPPVPPGEWRDSCHIPSTHKKKRQEIKDKF